MRAPTKQELAEALMDIIDNHNIPADKVMANNLLLTKYRKKRDKNMKEIPPEGEEVAHIQVNYNVAAHPPFVGEFDNAALVQDIVIDDAPAEDLPF